MSMNKLYISIVNVTKI